MCADVFVRTCAHGWVILKLCLKGKSAGLPRAPGSAAPQVTGGSTCASAAAGTPRPGNLVHLCPVISGQGMAVPACPSSVWHRSPSKAPEAALALWLHTPAEPMVPALLADQHQHHSDQSVPPWHSELRNC